MEEHQERMLISIQEAVVDYIDRDKPVLIDRVTDIEKRIEGIEKNIEKIYKLFKKVK